MNGSDGYIQLPRWVLLIRIAQGSLSALALALICYPAHVWGDSYWTGSTHSSLGFYIFACVWSFLVLGYLFITPLKFPAAYHRYAHVALEFTAAVFWLSAFAYLASFTRAFSGWQNIYLRKRADNDFNLDLDKILDNVRASAGGDTPVRGYRSGVQAWWILCAVDSAIGAIIWLLWSGTFALAAWELFKQFKSGKQPAPPSQPTYTEQQQYASREPHA